MEVARTQGQVIESAESGQRRNEFQGCLKREEKNIKREREMG
jgi:hypothetical protein